MSKQKEFESNNFWKNYGGRILLNTVSHPIEYAKVLIQIGYEPLPPRPTTTFFGKPALKLPNLFEYVKYIKKVDGFGGLYRGLFPKLCGSLVCAVTSENIQRYFEEEPRDPDDNEEVEELDRKQIFIRDLKREIACRTGAIIISHPFQVITVRIMAQFVGKETRYSGFFNPIAEIYRQNGISGFFTGLIPRLLGDLIFVLLASSLTYAVNSYIFDEENLRMYTSATMSFVVGAITYPFQVVSNCMVVSKSGLVAGNSPFMPPYVSWVDCWLDLSTRNQLKRGSSLLIRYYTGPQVIINGRPVQIPKNESVLLSK